MTSSSLDDLSSPLSPDEQSAAAQARRAESLSLHRARVAKRKAKEAADREVFGAVMKQLGESRLDHLHRWRNAFDATKMKMDRLLIKRLVSRAEARAHAIDGGPEALAPVVDAVLSAQEITEVAGLSGVSAAAAAAAGGDGALSPTTIHSTSRRHALTRPGSVAPREHLLLDDFAVTDQAIDGGGGEGEFASSNAGGWTGAGEHLTTDERVARSLGADAGRNHLHDQLQMRQGGADDAYARRKHTSGVQQRHAHTGSVIFEE